MLLALKLFERMKLCAVEESNFIYWIRKKQCIIVENISFTNVYIEGSRGNGVLWLKKENEKKRKCFLIVSNIKLDKCDDHNKKILFVIL